MNDSVTLHGTFGLALRNFTGYPELPDAQEIIQGAERAERLGYDSVWVWDHVLLGVDPNFPILDSLTMLTAIAARTSTVKLGTGVLVLPLRNPVTLAKQLASMDQVSNGRLLMGMAAGWYRREFNAVGVPHERRGALMDESLEILRRLWEEPMVDGEYGAHRLSRAVMYPKPVQSRVPILIGGYADRVLERAGRSGDGWLTYFYRPDHFVRSWSKVLRAAEDAGRDPATVANASQLPIMVGDSGDSVREPVMEWLNTEWDFPSHSDCSRDSAILGTVDDCVDQLSEHIAAGVQKIIMVPYRYQPEQVRVIAEEVLPKLRARPGFGDAGSAPGS